jgi:hypothetical protein
VQHGGAHLGADPLPLMAPSEPGARIHLAQDGEVTRVDGLLSHDIAAARHREVERPVPRGPTSQCQPVVLDDAPGDLIGPLVGPRYEERHHIGIVDAFGRHLRQGGQLLRRGQPQLKSWRPQPQPQQRKVIDQHAPIVATASRARHPIFFGRLCGR